MTLPVSKTSLGPGDCLSNVSTNVTDRGRGLALKLENVAICHQICVLRRLYHETTEMGTSLQIWSKWRAALTIVQPETVTAWHRKGFSPVLDLEVRREKTARPAASRELRDLIRRKSDENPLCAPSLTRPVGKDCHSGTTVTISPLRLTLTLSPC
jgi:hypothetical protein